MELSIAPVAYRTGQHPGPTADLPRPALTHRADVDGLRAVAILLVVAYHARVPGFAGGFIGVDVFFVLSGYLITRLIIAEADRTGSVHLGRFWLRRFRRLFPAAATMIGAVLAASLVIESPLEWRARTESAFASLTYWSNHLFAREVGTYFSPDVETNPFLHTWSLAVEEQFYVLWPLLFFLLGMFVDARRTSGRNVRIGATAGFVAASFLVSLRLTEDASSLGFYSALSRAWEFGAGALLAMLTVSSGAIAPGSRRRLTAIGAAVLVLAMVVIDDATRYPGTAALLPVLATLMLLAAEPSDRVVGRLLRSGPARTIGLVSYSWYLWHWPVIVLGTVQLGSDSTGVRTLLAGAALLPAALTYRMIENPIRRSPRLARSPRATVLVLGGFVATAVALMGLARIQADRASDDPLVATLAEARSDITRLDGVCTLLDPDPLRTHCSAGPPDASLDDVPTVLLVGDSHGAHWLPAVDAAVAELGWSRIASVRVECPSIAFDWTGRHPECEERQLALPDLIGSLDPDLVVMSHSVGYVGEEPDEDDVRRWRAALADFARTLDGLGTDLLVLLDVPRFPADPLSCAARHDDLAACDLDRAEVEALLAPHHAAERAALTDADHGSTLDPLPLLCHADTCPLAPDGAVAYADEHHLTGSFSASLGPEVAAVMAAATTLSGT